MQRIINPMELPRRSVPRKAKNGRHKLTIAPLLLILMTVVCFVANPINQVIGAQVTGTVDELVRQSRYIFRGTVRQINASTVPNIPTEGLAIVRVDEVYLAPTTLGNFTGKEITVSLMESPPTEAGQQWVFFTVGWLYAQSIAVLEIGRVEFKGDTAGVIRQQIAAALQKISDETLTARLNRADLVVVGKVAGIKTIGGQAQRKPFTEHDPEWQEAMLTVDSVEKGQLPQLSAVIVFPSSQDELWVDSPKFQVGQEGIWILRRDQQEKGSPILRIPGLTALDPLDFQTKDQLDRIRRLLKGPQ